MTFPIDRFSDIEPDQVDDTRISNPRLYRNRARGNKTSYIMLSLTTDRLKYAEYMPLNAKIMGYEGSLELFTLSNPLPALGVNSGDTVATTANQLSKVITVTSTGTYFAGDLVQFQGNAKAYFISNAVDNGSTVTLTLSSPLVAQVASGQEVYYGADVNFQMCVSSRSLAKITASNGKLGIIDVELIEQL